MHDKGGSNWWLFLDQTCSKDCLRWWWWSTGRRGGREARLVYVGAAAALRWGCGGIQWPLGKSFDGC